MCVCMWWKSTLTGEPFSRISGERRQARGEQGARGERGAPDYI